MISVRYGAGRGGFLPLRPGRDTGRGGIFWGNPRPFPRPGRVPANSLDGAPFLTTQSIRGPSREWAGSEAGVKKPKKTRPAPGRSAGQGWERGRGPAVVGAPEAP